MPLTEIRTISPEFRYGLSTDTDVFANMKAFHFDLHFRRDLNREEFRRSGGIHHQTLDRQ